MAISEVDLIMQKVSKLSDQNKLNLIQRIAEFLKKEKNDLKTDEPKYLIFGEFYDERKMSSEEDFKLAEYHFKEEEWQ